MNSKFLLKQILLLLILLLAGNSFYAQSTDPSLTLLSPNGGEYWTAGSFPRITWKSENITVIKIEISYDGGIVWEIISPASIAIYGYYSNWQISSTQSNQCLIKISKYDNPNIYDISESYFNIATDNSINTLVVLGSSTAAGVGASSIDSAWVTKYKNYLFEKNTTMRVINLAVGGFTTYDIMPTGYIPPLNRPTPKIANNITRAVAYDPKTIIINLPSNDINLGFAISEQLSNYDTILAVANEYNIPVWVSTTQPRNFTAEQIMLQIEMRDSTFSRFKEKAIDFWTDIADSNGRIIPELDSGDGIHLNDKGHAILFSRVVEAEIFNTIFLSVEDFKNELIVYELMQNYPNPFNPTTTIKYQIPTDGFVTIKVYDILGAEVATLVNEKKMDGQYEVYFNASNLSSGIYIYTLRVNNFVSSKKIVLLK